MRRWAIAALLCARFVAPAGAHETSYSHATLRWDGARVSLEVLLHRDDAAPVAGVAVAESLLAPRVLAGAAPALAAYVERGLHLRDGARELTLRFVRVVPAPEKHGVALAFTADAAQPIGRLGVHAALFPASAQHETFVDAYAGGRLARQAVLTAEQPELELYDRGAAGVLAVMRTFVAAGVHHIFIGPDHILFIVGLMLLGGGLARVLKVATAFTLAHSITLALAATGVVNVPSRLVEPLIAASIVYVGIENLRAKPGAPDRRVALAFGFGLIHGLGFASVLREFGLPREALAWSLVAFNVGVELGQACIVLAVTPALGLLRARQPSLAWRAAAAASCAIIAAGGWWLVQRIFSAA